MAITIDKKDPYNFLLNGKKFYPHGITRFGFHNQNSGENKLTAKEFIKRMSSSGINSLRTVIPGEFERGVEPELGKYNENFLHNTDEVFEACEANGIQIILCLFDSSSFFAPWSPNAWRDGVYSSKFSSHMELFTNLELRKYMKGRVEFLINHFSKYSNIFSWEVMNEMNKIGELYGKEDCKKITMEWYSDMAEHIKQIAPKHLVVGSLYGDEVWEELNKSNVNDFVQIHTYKEELDPENNSKVITNYCKDNKKFNKPVVITEFASKKDNPKRKKFVKNGIISAQKEDCSAWLYASVWDNDAEFGMGHGDMNEELFEVFSETRKS